MRREADTLDAFDESDIERYYPFYCVDMVHEVLSRQLEDNQDEVCEIMQETPEISFLQLPKLSVPDMRFDLDYRVWTKGDTLSQLSNYVPGAIAQLLTAYAGGLIREKEVSRQGAPLKPKILDIFPEFRNDVLQAVHDIYTHMKENITKQVADYLNDRQSQLIEREKEIKRLQSLSDAQKEEAYGMADALMKGIEKMKKEMLLEQ